MDFATRVGIIYGTVQRPTAFTLDSTQLNETSRAFGYATLRPVNEERSMLLKQDLLPDDYSKEPS